MTCCSCVMRGLEPLLQVHAYPFFPDNPLQRIPAGGRCGRRCS